MPPLRRVGAVSAPSAGDGPGHWRPGIPRQWPSSPCTTHRTTGDGNATTADPFPVGPCDSPSRSSALRVKRTPPGSVVLRVDGLQKRYGTTEAVAGVTFEIRAGEVFGLLGRNGAGKTTTISMLATARRPSGGDAMLFGESLRGAPKAVRRMIGVVPQDLAV